MSESRRRAPTLDVDSAGVMSFGWRQNHFGGSGASNYFGRTLFFNDAFLTACWGELDGAFRSNNRARTDWLLRVLQGANSLGALAVAIESDSREGVLSSWNRVTDCFVNTGWPPWPQLLGMQHYLTSMAGFSPTDITLPRSADLPAESMPAETSRFGSGPTRSLTF